MNNVTNINPSNKAPIPPRDTWGTATVDQLIDAKIRLYDIYLFMRKSNPTLADQYRRLADEADAVISQKLNPPEPEF